MDVDVNIIMQKLSVKIANLEMRNAQLESLVEAYENRDKEQADSMVNPDSMSDNAI